MEEPTHKWLITAYESLERKRSTEIEGTQRDIIGILRLLTCTGLSIDEVVDTLEDKASHLGIRTDTDANGNDVFTAGHNPHFTAKKLPDTTK